MKNSMNVLKTKGKDLMQDYTLGIFHYKATLPLYSKISPIVEVVYSKTEPIIRSQLPCLFYRGRHVNISYQQAIAFPIIDEHSDTAARIIPFSISESTNKIINDVSQAIWNLITFSKIPHPQSQMDEFINELESIFETSLTI